MDAQMDEGVAENRGEPQESDITFMPNRTETRASNSSRSKPSSELLARQRSGPRRAAADPKQFNVCSFTFFFMKKLTEFPKLCLNNQDHLKTLCMTTFHSICFTCLAIGKLLADDC